MPLYASRADIPKVVPSKSQGADSTFEAGSVAGSERTAAGEGRAVGVPGSASPRASRSVASTDALTAQPNTDSTKHNVDRQKVPVKRADFPQRAATHSAGDSGRVPPQDFAAEQGVLGSVLLSNEVIEKIPALRPEHFYRTAHQVIYRAMVGMLTPPKPIPVDLLTLMAGLRSTVGLEAAGGPAYLAGLSDAEFTTANVSFYASIVIEKGARRTLIHALSQVVDDLHDEQIPLGVSMGRITDALDTIYADERKDP